MSELAEKSLAQAYKALLQRDDRLAQKVHDEDSELDRLQMEIDESCVQLIALREPKARDLRFIVMSMKIASELERVGDQAVNIAHRVLNLIKEPAIEINEDIPVLAKKVQEMIRDAMDAFVYHRPETARLVIQRDDEADALTRKIHSDLVGRMTQTPTAVSRYLCLISVAHNLERSADYATNIAEEIVYLYEGKDIRHHKP